MQKLKMIITNFMQGQSFERALIIVVSCLSIMVISYFVKRILNKNIRDTHSRYKARKAANILSYILIIIVFLLVYNDKLGNVGMVLTILIERL